MVRCKLKCIEKAHLGGESWRLKFSAVYDPTIPEDVKFNKASPSAEFSIYVDNPAAAAKFEAGHSYFFDAVPVE